MNDSLDDLWVINLKQSESFRNCLVKGDCRSAAVPYTRGSVLQKSEEKKVFAVNNQETKLFRILEQLNVK